MGKAISTETFLDQASRLIKEKFHPEKVMLFGSRAWGKPGPGSDVDLLVVMKTKMRFPRQAALIRLAVDEALGVSVPMDILVRSAASIRESLREGDAFIGSIMARGRSL